MIDWLGVLWFIFAFLAFLSGIVGYPVCLGLIGPIILEANGIRKTRESVLYFGNTMLMEHDLKHLASQRVPSAMKLLRVVDICKWSVLVNLSLAAILFFL